MSDRSNDWADVGVTRIGSDSCHCIWVIFRRWNNDPNTDEFWDGTQWLRSPEEAIAHEDFSSGFVDMFQAYSNEGLDDEAAGRPKAAQRSRESLESQHGEVWDGSQLAAEFDILGFAAPLIKVTRKSNGKKGSFVFQNHPRFYFLFIEG